MIERNPSAAGSTGRALALADGPTGGIRIPGDPASCAAAIATHAIAITPAAIKTVVRERSARTARRARGRGAVGAGVGISPGTAGPLAAPSTAGLGSTSWMAADSSLQKSDAVRSESTTDSPVARGPNGTSSSRGPNQSRGRSTTLLGSGSLVPSSLCGSLVSTRLQNFLRAATVASSSRDKVYS